MMWKIRNLSKKNKIIAISVSAAAIAIGSILGVYSYVRHSYNNIVVTEPTDKQEYTGIPEEEQLEEIDYGMESDIVNILLVGVDTRGAFEDSRTDSMIIATIDPTTSKVKLTSLMRDMYVEIPGKGYNKINVAYEIGGIELLKKTIKHNFGFAVDNYAAIDFKGFQSLIDLMGGIDVNIKSNEVSEINKYIIDVNESNPTLLQSEGFQKLNGQQALSYSRIRKVGNNDYERTERQRTVLSLLLAKVKDTKVTSYPKLYSTISPYIRTNIEFNSMLKLVYTVYKLDDFTPGSFRIPVDGHFKDTTVRGMAVLVPDLKYNADELYKFIYNTVPSNLKVADNSKIYNADVVVPKREETEKEASANTQLPISPTTENPAISNPSLGTGSGAGAEAGTGANSNTGTGEGTNPGMGSSKGTGTDTGGKTITGTESNTQTAADASTAKP
jgi:LCP family protein required for cell wall assembly